MNKRGFVTTSCSQAVFSLIENLNFHNGFDSAPRAAFLQHLFFTLSANALSERVSGLLNIEHQPQPDGFCKPVKAGHVWPSLAGRPTVVRRGLEVCPVNPLVEGQVSALHPVVVEFAQNFRNIHFLSLLCLLLFCNLPAASS